MDPQRSLVVAVSVDILCDSVRSVTGVFAPVRDRYIFRRLQLSQLVCTVTLYSVD